MEDMHENFGVMTVPGNKMIPLGIQEGRKFGVDSGAFKKKFNPEKFFEHLEKLQPYRENCLFIAVPDAFGDAWKTLELWNKWADSVREYGPVALVAQDGLKYDTYSGYFYVGSDLDFTDWCGENGHDVSPEDDTLYMDLYDEWRSQIDPDEFDWLFIGGHYDKDNFARARENVAGALMAGKPVHVGRVNSIKRFQLFKSLGCSSADGTTAKYNPTMAKRYLTYAVSQPLLHTDLPDIDHSS